MLDKNAPDTLVPEAFFHGVRALATNNSLDIGRGEQDATCFFGSPLLNRLLSVRIFNPNLFQLGIQMLFQNDCGFD